MAKFHQFLGRKRIILQIGEKDIYTHIIEHVGS
jgi:hypothetical protein